MVFIGGENAPSVLGGLRVSGCRVHGVAQVVHVGWAQRRDPVHQLSRFPREIGFEYSSLPPEIWYATSLGVCFSGSGLKGGGGACRISFQGGFRV